VQNGNKSLVTQEKHQIPNDIQIPISNDQNGFVSEIGNLVVEHYLEFGIWILGFQRLFGSGYPIGGGMYEDFEHAAYGTMYRLSLLFPRLRPPLAQAAFLGQGGNPNPIDGRSFYRLRGQALSGL
jgi:hypothetical protein